MTACTDAPASADEAVDMLLASLDFLAGADWRQLGGRAQRSGLRALGVARSRWTAAHAAALRALEEGGGYAAEGHPSAQAWLRHQGKMTRRAATDLASAADRCQGHPLLAAALREGWLSESWARQLAAWTSRLPGGEVMKADRILLDAARAGLPLYPGIARLAQAIYETVHGGQPGPGDPGDGLADRNLKLRTTLGGAGHLAGDLSASCAALLAQVLETFGKPAGRGDLRTPGERSHDALEEALRLSLGHPGVPPSGGVKTRAVAVMSLADLLSLDGAGALCDAWLAARAGEPGWLSGDAARAAACTAQVSPIVTGTPDWDVISDMADVFLAAHGLDAGSHHGQQAGRVALEQALLAMAIRALSGPGGLAGFLRTNLLGRPFNGASLILDAGDTDAIPAHIRRAVALRDGHCQWPGGCDRPASHCEPHHLRPRCEGGDTSVENLRLYCFAHHHVFIHRLGWKVTHHPDGSRTATSPNGWTIRSHDPPVARGA